MRLLSKSDFKLAINCPTKLYYKKKHYPNKNDQDEYLLHLARGGYMVGKLATLLYPDGIEVETGADYEKAEQLTKELLERENVTIFEAAIRSNGKIIRVDILEKKNNMINLIEVKSKSYETTSDEKKKKNIEKGLEDYILDVAYQYYVTKETYPSWEIKPFLFLPDKSKNTSIDGLISLFSLKENFDEVTGFRKYEVTFEGNIEDIKNDNLLTLVDIEDKVKELQPLVEKQTSIFLNSLNEELEKIETQVSKECFKCEFTLTDELHQNSGYSECWENFPKVEHHISDLYYIGALGGYKNPLANKLIQKGEVSFENFPLDELKDGSRKDRIKTQIEYTLSNKEWINETLEHELNTWEYPLHFIDFETTMTALPFNKGMRPYEVLNFQWSCHSIEKPGSNIVHSEWISLEPSFPSFKFAESLMQTIGDSGTPLIWSSYENTMLKTIYDQYHKYNYNNPELLEWLELMIKFDKDDNGKFVDMNKIALENYFHPLMKGKTSIKWTLPAVLNSNESDLIENLLEHFEPGISLLKKDENNKIINPYKLLPPLDIYDNAEIISDGTGAMSAYEDIIFGLRKGNAEELEKYRNALLRYCKLDTLAMVIIWMHWENKVNKI